jgi:peptidoglycan hydrolase-like protein with peptidoglycan-binding domain
MEATLCDLVRYTNLANELRRYGCRVVEVNGWQTRGSSTFSPKGVVAHHTASSSRGGDAPALGICINGRSDLPGPLCQVLISRSGICYVIAAGRANHAGTGGYRGLSGNSSVFGIEAENNGVGEPWSKAALDAYERCAAAMLDITNRGSEWLCAHREWTSRKIDPTGINMDQFRASVGRRLNNPGTSQPGYNPSVPGTAGSTSTLKLGSRGAEVRSLQNTLNFWKMNAGIADGVFGQQTKEAVIRMQQKLKIKADGEWGPASKAAYDKFAKTMAALASKPTKPAKPVAPAQTPVLRIGDKGDAVKWLQQLLVNKGYRVTVDGSFGPATQKAVMTVQVKAGKPADGIVGPVTWGLLK